MLEPIGGAAKPKKSLPEAMRLSIADKMAVVGLLVLEFPTQAPLVAWLVDLVHPSEPYQY